MNKRVGILLSVVALISTLIPTTVLAAGDGVTINEVRIDQPSTDLDEYFELTGPAGTDLSGHAYIVIGDGAGGSGVIESITDLSGMALDSDGYFVAAESSFTLGTADLVTSLGFENSDNVTHMLVAGFTGTNQQDLDTDDDGILDVTPWDSIVDSIALVESPGGGDQIYSTATVGPDGTFVPGHVYDCTEDGWLIGSFSPADDTPGAVNTCDAAPPPPPTGTPYLISEVQGPGSSSPVQGETVEIEGVVVGVYQTTPELGQRLGGFMLQEEAADQDADPNTSEGIFVFAPFAEVAVGDVVKVVGTAVEFFGYTEISPTLHVEKVGSAPHEVVGASVALPVADWEIYEGMLVTFSHDLYISEYFNFDRFNQVVGTTTRQYQGTHAALPGADANAIAAANAANRVTIDDGRTVSNPEVTLHPDGTPFTLDNRFRGGDRLVDFTGVVNFSFGRFSVVPANPGVGNGQHVEDNPRPSGPDDVGGDIQVATFNVLNFFTHIDAGPNICGPTQRSDCRGADSQQEYDRQLAKLLAGIRASGADVVGLQEIENDILDETLDGNRAHDPVLTLVEELNALDGAGTWAWVGEANHYNDYPIRNEIIYRTDAVEPIGDPMAYADEAFDLNRPGTFEPVGRPPLAQIFRPTVQQGGGQQFAVVVNHFKSKGSPCSNIGDPNTGDGQGNCNLTRLAQSNALLDFIDTFEDDVMGVLVIGDLNSYAMEDPVRALEGAGYTDLLEHFIGADAYSYVFDGQLGYLDYVLASRSMLNKITGATSFHINADEPDLLDYDTTFKSDGQDALYEPNEYRASDHDPVIVGIQFSGKK